MVIQAMSHAPSPCHVIPLVPDLSHCLLQLCGHTMQHLASGESAAAGEYHHMAARRAAMECPSEPACSGPLAIQIAQADPRLQTRALGDSSTAASKFSAIAARPHDGGDACEVQQASVGALLGSKRPRAGESDAQQRKSQALPKPVLIDFGSVGCMGLLGDARRLLSVLLAALEKTGLRGTVLTGARPHHASAQLSTHPRAAHTISQARRDAGAPCD